MIAFRKLYERLDQASVFFETSDKATWSVGSYVHGRDDGGQRCRIMGALTKPVPGAIDDDLTKPPTEATFSAVLEGVDSFPGRQQSGLKEVLGGQDCLRVEPKAGSNGHQQVHSVPSVHLVPGIRPAEVHFLYKVPGGKLTELLGVRRG